MAERLNDKSVIESILRKNIGLHIYSIGDLDDFFWPYTTWYSDVEMNSIVMVYTGYKIPTLLALSENIPDMSGLLHSILHLLPDKFYAHLSPGLEYIFRPDRKLEHHGLHLKMLLMDSFQINNLDCSKAIKLSFSDLPAIRELYKESYPDNWFDMRMLETNQFYGVKDNNGKLVSIAGIHVYSEKYKVAALGNITTHPSFRGKGWGSLVTAAVCKSLSGKIDSIGLNVKADNKPAISCYEKLGFKIVAEYEELMIGKSC